MHRSDFGLKLITKPYYQKVIWDSSLPISNSETLTSKREDQISSMQVVFHLLVKSSITASTFAADPRIDSLRAKINCKEDKSFSADYHDPQKRSIANAMTITLSDGTVLDEVVVEYPVGHKRRREEGIPLLKAKYQTNLARVFEKSQQSKIEELTLNFEKLSATKVDEVMELFTKR